MTERFNRLDWTSLVLVLIGGINWGLVGFFGFDLVAAIFGDFSAFTRVVYAAVGIAALYMAIRSAQLFEGVTRQTSTEGRAM